MRPSFPKDRYLRPFCQIKLSISTSLIYSASSLLFCL